MNRTYLLWFLVAGSLSGCSGDELSISHDKSQQAALLRTSIRVRLGGADAVGPESFGKVVGALLSTAPDEVVIADGLSSDLRVFTLDGEYRRSIGRKGAGPGEFRAIRSLWRVAPDRLAVWDIQLARVTVFDDAGGFTRSFPIDLKAYQSTRPTFVGPLPNGALVMRDRPDVRDQTGLRDGLRREPIRLLYVDSMGYLSHTIRTVDGAEEWFQNRDGGWGYSQPIFGEDFFAVTMGSEILVGVNDGSDLRRITSEGKMVVGQRMHLQPSPATDRQIESERLLRIEGVKRLPAGVPFREEIWERHKELIRNLVARDAVPSFDRLVPTRSGELWVRAYPLPSDDQCSWLRIGSNNEPTGRILLDRSATIMDGDRDVLLILEKDQFDADVISILNIHEE